MRTRRADQGLDTSFHRTQQLTVTGAERSAASRRWHIHAGWWWGIGGGGGRGRLGGARELFAFVDGGVCPIDGCLFVGGALSIDCNRAGCHIEELRSLGLIWSSHRGSLGLIGAHWGSFGTHLGLTWGSLGAHWVQSGGEPARLLEQERMVARLAQLHEDVAQVGAARTRKTPPTATTAV